MASGIKISALPAASGLTGAEQIPVVQSGVTRRATLSEIITSQITGPVAGISPDGLVGDGVTDNLTQIQIALTAMADLGGGTVYLPGGIFVISDTLNIPSGVTLQGIGGGQISIFANINSPEYAATPRTRLLAMAGFPADHAMVSVATAPHAAYVHQNCGVVGLMLDCDLVAERGLDVISVKKSKFIDLLISRPKSGGIGIYEGVLAIIDATTLGNNATQFNYWRNIEILCRDPDNTAVCWSINGTTQNNSNMSIRENIQFTNWDGNGLELHCCDTDSWFRVSGASLGAGYGCVMYGDTPTSGGAGWISMYQTQFAASAALGGVGGLLVKAGVLVHSHGNVVFGYNLGNNTPLPTIENGAGLTYYTEEEFYVSQPNIPASFWERTNSYVSGATIVQMVARAKDTGGEWRDYLQLRGFARGAAGLEQGEWTFWTALGAAASTQKAKIRDGLTVGDATVLDKGMGAINAREQWVSSNDPVAPAYWQSHSEFDYLTGQIVGGLQFWGKDNAGTLRPFVQVHAYIRGAAGSEVGELNFRQSDGATSAIRGQCRHGWIFGDIVGATDEGAGTINAMTAVYVNNNKMLGDKLAYLAPVAAPANPASGWVLYTDSGDGNKLKAKASTGTTVTLGTP